MTFDDTFDFAGLYRRYAPGVFRYALFLSGDRTVAEDVVSEAFLIAWRRRQACAAAAARRRSRTRTPTPRRRRTRRMR